MATVAQVLSHVYHLLLGPSRLASVVLYKNLPYGRMEWKCFNGQDPLLSFVSNIESALERPLSGSFRRAGQVVFCGTLQKFTLRLNGAEMPSWTRPLLSGVSNIEEVAVGYSSI
ncbi:hypothetical protein AVEN_236222-1 [Araneus ventricosus]|uniref:Uncharacterized protein n=1 Tax=Araneus ventricosus TaxID=182803 RepID=A0A4Y2CAQ2_ARAVE|nr:hypothetical protein AVEN_236222-1 [Araneus ventricosus]